MNRSSAFIAAVVASTAAGPLFLAWLALAAYCLNAPRTTGIELAGLVGLSMMIVPAVLVGFVLAFLPNLIGSWAMARLAAVSELARAPAAWIGAGTIAGAGLDRLAMGLGDAPELRFALVATSAISALICQRQMRPFDQTNRSTTSASGSTASRSGVR